MSDNKVDPLEDTRAESIRPGKLIAGAPIGGYNLLEVLGEGGMGVVWAAHDPLLDRRIAIKVLKHGGASPQLRLRLLREGRAMAKLKHPNVLTVFEVGTEGERDFIAMEMVEGGPLDSWLATHPPRDEVMAALLASGRGLAAAHAAGLVHRDFKPNNVLRSKDGRVLVTDFGLARGLGEDWGAALSASGNTLEQAADLASHDSVLHSPLTRTGALIGTPAYMAPEQFTGSEPDPRTDQFAYCVTAWQALTGARPFHGKSLDELRQAANAGVEMVVSDLPRPLRRVLTRGLDPDPDKRWPDLTTLLAELETANRPRRPRWPIYAGIAAVAVIGIVVAVKLSGGGAALPACEPADAVWANAGGKPDDRRIAAAFDGHKKRWFAAYEQSCKDVVAKQRGADAKVGCLREVRARTASTGELIGTGLDPFVALIAPEICAQGNVAIPAQPVAIADLEAGLRSLATGDLETARAAFEKARVAAESSDPRTTALARIALLEVSLAKLEHPEELSPKRDTMHDEIGRLLTYAKAAVKAAGNEPVLVGLLAMREAEAIADLAERAPKKAVYGDAIKRAADARAQFELIGDVRRIASAAALSAELALRRGDSTSLSEADHVANPVAEMLAREGEKPNPALETVLARVAFARADYEDAAKAYDKIPQTSRASSAPTYEGVVLDADGKPAINATVIAWTGELSGDPRHLITDRRTVTGEIVETGADGKFTIHAPLGAAIVAQRGDLVSPPAFITNKPSLKLAATTEVTGKVDGKVPFGAMAFARIGVGNHAWLIRAAVAKEGQTFRIAHLPAGSKPQFGVQLELGGTIHRETAPSVTKVAWPDGLELIDVVVKGGLRPGARLALFPHKVNAGASAQAIEIDELIARGTDVAFGPPIPIGSRITEAGRSIYATGTHHAILLGERGGSACATAGEIGAVACAEVKDGAVLIELP